MSKARAGMTLAELLANQAIDPKYQAMRREKDLALAEIAKQRRHEQSALLSDLASVGVDVDWVGRLLELPTPDQRIYPVLLSHLTKPYSPWLSEWIGRAFGRKSARAIVWGTLVSLLKAHSLSKAAAEGVFTAISTMAQPSDIDVLIDLLSDASLGAGRIYLIGNLMRSKRPNARATLIRHKADPDLTKEITSRLSRARA